MRAIVLEFLRRNGAPQRVTIDGDTSRAIVSMRWESGLRITEHIPAGQVLSYLDAVAGPNQEIVVCERG